MYTCTYTYWKWYFFQNITDSYITKLSVNCLILRRWINVATTPCGQGEWRQETTLLRRWINVIDVDSTLQQRRVASVDDVRKRQCCDGESTSLTLIQLRNNVVCPCNGNDVGNDVFATLDQRHHRGIKVATTSCAHCELRRDTAIPANKLGVLVQRLQWTQHWWYRKLVHRESITKNDSPSGIWGFRHHQIRMSVNHPKIHTDQFGLERHAHLQLVPGRADGLFF